jgi:hypothetical protein
MESKIQQLLDEKVAAGVAPIAALAVSHGSPPRNDLIMLNVMQEKFKLLTELDNKLKFDSLILKKQASKEVSFPHSL